MMYGMVTWDDIPWHVNGYGISLPIWSTGVEIGYSDDTAWANTGAGEACGAESFTGHASIVFARVPPPPPPTKPG